MKTLATCILILISTLHVCAQQLIPGTLDVIGMPSLSQSIADLVKEAGLDDTSIGFESSSNAIEITFKLDEGTDPVTGTPTTSDENCEQTVNLYKVYMHTDGTPSNLVIEAKTVVNGGMRFPADTFYDQNPGVHGIFGARDLRVENGGSYITIPNDASVAIKVAEFVGCRQDIPFQFNIKPSALTDAGSSNFSVYYTIVGSITN